MFTTTQIKEIAQKLQAMGLRDSQFSRASLPPTGDETFSVVQDGQNKNLTFKELVENIPTFSLSDLLQRLDEMEQTLTMTMQSLSSQEIEKIQECQALVDQCRQTVIKSVGDSKTEILKDAHTNYAALSAILTEMSEKIASILSELTGNCTLTVVSTQSGAKVYLNGQQTGSIQVKRGTLVAILITDESDEQLNNLVVSVTATSTLSLSPTVSGGAITTETLTVTATPDDATIEIDGKIRSSISVISGTSVHVKVSKEGYVTQEEDVIVTSTTSKSYTLVEREEEYWSDLVLTESDYSPCPIDGIPAVGGLFILKASVTVHWNDGSTSTRTDGITIEEKFTTSPDVNSHITPSGSPHTRFSLDANTAVSQRQFMLTLYTKGPDEQEISGSVQITQLAAEETLDVSPESLEVPAAGGAQTVQIASNTSWSIAVQDS